MGTAADFTFQCCNDMDKVLPALAEILFDWFLLLHPTCKILAVRLCFHINGAFVYCGVVDGILRESMSTDRKQQFLHCEYIVLGGSGIMFAPLEKLHNRPRLGAHVTASCFHGSCTIDTVNTL